MNWVNACEKIATFQGKYTKEEVLLIYILFLTTIYSSVTLLASNNALYTKPITTSIKHFFKKCPLLM